VPNVHGDWVNLANNGLCGIFQANAMLIMVNENGNLATAQIQGNRIYIMQGWNVSNLVALIGPNANVIQYNNGSQWQRV
jgi:hypothetical protein